MTYWILTFLVIMGIASCVKLAWAGIDALVRSVGTTDLHKHPLFERKVRGWLEATVRCDAPLDTLVRAKNRLTQEGAGDLEIAAMTEACRRLAEAPGTVMDTSTKEDAK